MATAAAIYTQATFVPSLTAMVPHSRTVVKQRSQRVQSIMPFQTSWKRAKEEADGGIVFVDCNGGVSVYNEDAELIARELGLYVDDEPVNGMETSLQFKASHLEMYALLLSTSGHADIWVMAQGGNTQPSFERFTFADAAAARLILGKRKI